VQSQQEPERRQQDQRWNDVLGVGGDRRSGQQGRGHEGGLLDPCDLPFGSSELHQQPHREDNSNKGAVAEIGDRPGNAVDGFEPREDEGNEAEETQPEHGDEDRDPRPERETPDRGERSS
jgi:hypothetical protein